MTRKIQIHQLPRELPTTSMLPSLCNNNKFSVLSIAHNASPDACAANQIANLHSVAKPPPNVRPRPNTGLSYATVDCPPPKQPTPAATERTGLLAADGAPPKSTHAADDPPCATP